VRGSFAPRSSPPRRRGGTRERAGRPRATQKVKKTSLESSETFEHILRAGSGSKHCRAIPSTSTGCAKRTAGRARTERRASTDRVRSSTRSGWRTTSGGCSTAQSLGRTARRRYNGSTSRRATDRRRDRSAFPPSRTRSCNVPWRWCSRPSTRRSFTPFGPSRARALCGRFRLRLRAEVLTFSRHRGNEAARCLAWAGGRKKRTWPSPMGEGNIIVDSTWPFTRMASRR
jgi:hypothetical protein